MCISEQDDTLPRTLLNPACRRISLIYTGMAGRRLERPVVTNACRHPLNLHRPYVVLYRPSGFSHALTHLLTHTPIPLTHALIIHACTTHHPRTRSLTHHAYTHSLIPLTHHSLMHPLTHSLIPLTHALTHSLMHEHTHPLYSSSLTHALTHPSNSLTHPLTHST
jgi:hypothetical protein